ncbi:hypothetical protein [Peribacillus aracenensis]|uniref:hypothetical protein n=1 Tax=Peribacillus aracenensis TaxID=2976708 RepID=UPI0021A35E5C|nr:hypothetical protein [Peribacillus sp. BBB004]
MDEERMCAVRAHIFCVGPVIRTLNMGKNAEFSPNAVLLRVKTPIPSWWEQRELSTK